MARTNWNDYIPVITAYAEEHKGFPSIASMNEHFKSLGLAELSAAHYWNMKYHITKSEEFRAKNGDWYPPNKENKVQSAGKTKTESPNPITKSPVPVTEKPKPFAKNTEDGSSNKNTPP